MAIKQKRTIIKHREIFNDICNGIMEGRFIPGQKIPTEKELASHYGASRPTVGRALRDLEQKGLITRHQGVGTFVRDLSHVRGKTLGILIPSQITDAESNVTLSVFGTLIPELSRVSSQHNYSLLLNESPAGTENSAIERARKICQQLIDIQVAGVFFMPLEVSPENADINEEIAEKFLTAGIQVTLLDRDIYDSPDRSKFDQVGINNKRASFILTRHLLDQGCTKIDFCAGPTKSSVVTDRISGYQNALLKSHIEPAERRIHNIEFLSFLQDNSSQQENRDARELIDQIKNNEIDALICINDASAALLMRFLTNNGISLPNDIMIAGFDDLPINQFLPVPLTTVHQHTSAIAHEAVRTILDRIENPDMPARDIMLSTKLVIRQSTEKRNNSN